MIHQITIASIVYASEDTGEDAPCVFTFSDGRTISQPKSWRGFFNGVEGGRNGAGEECEWRDGTELDRSITVAAAFGGKIGAYVAPEEPPAEKPDRLSVLEAVLIEKSLLTQQEIDEYAERGRLG